MGGRLLYHLCGILQGITLSLAFRAIDHYRAQHGAYAPGVMLTPASQAKALLRRGKILLENKSRTELNTPRLFRIIPATRNTKDRDVVEIQIRQCKSSPVKCIEEIHPQFQRRRFRELASSSGC